MERNNESNNNEEEDGLESPTMMIHIVSLTDLAFQEAIQRYMDENKPDPLLQIPQMQSWKFHWQPGDASVYNHNNDTTTTTTGIFMPFRPTHVLTGLVEWQGDYCAVGLSSTCIWKGNRSHGSLFFRVHAKIRLLEVIAAANSNNNPTIIDIKVRKKMLDRLRSDDYISKLLINYNNNNNNKETKDVSWNRIPLESSNELCQASICVDEQHQQLEERVHVNEDVAEAIRRAVFSTADAPLDVFDIVCQLPLLPCCQQQQEDNKNTKNDDEWTTPLANRAKLRLLEDAMYDACEKEEEEQVIDQLKIIDETKTSKKQRQR